MNKYIKITTLAYCSFFISNTNILANPKISDATAVEIKKVNQEYQSPKVVAVDNKKVNQNSQKKKNEKSKKIDNYSYKDALPKPVGTGKPKLVFGNLVYVNPWTVKNVRDYKHRLNLYGAIYAGPGFAIGDGSTKFPTRYLGNIDAGFGFEMILNKFYMSVGADMYALIGGDSIVDGSQEWVFGYKFRLALGGIIDVKGFPLTKIYALYRDNQLQLSGGTSPLFGYYSRNVGAGASFLLGKGVEIGLDIYFSLMHPPQHWVTRDPNHKIISTSSRNNYPFISTQLFIKFTF